jgi:nucleoside-diphosphate-sugar epimerase
VAGIFHTASPVKFHVEDIKTELIDPAVQGTLSVLESAAKSQAVKRVVITSSIVSVIDYFADTRMHMHLSFSISLSPFPFFLPFFSLLSSFAALPFR